MQNFNVYNISPDFIIVLVRALLIEEEKSNQHFAIYVICVIWCHIPFDVKWCRNWKHGKFMIITLKKLFLSWYKFKKCFWSKDLLSGFFLRQCKWKQKITWWALSIAAKRATPHIFPFFLHEFWSRWFSSFGDDFERPPNPFEWEILIYNIF